MISLPAPVTVTMCQSYRLRSFPKMGDGIADLSQSPKPFNLWHLFQKYFKILTFKSNLMSYYAPKVWILLAAIFANFPRKQGDINDCIDTSFVGCLHNFPNINNEAKYRTHTGIFFQEINRTPFFLFSTAGALVVITV